MITPMDQPSGNIRVIPPISMGSVLANSPTSSLHSVSSVSAVVENVCMNSPVNSNLLRSERVPSPMSSESTQISSPSPSVVSVINAVDVSLLDPASSCTDTTRQVVPSVQSSSTSEQDKIAACSSSSKLDLLLKRTFSKT